MVSSWARLSLADALEVADDAEEAIAHAGELGLALLEHARHGPFFPLSRSWRMAAKPSTTDFTRW